MVLWFYKLHPIVKRKIEIDEVKIEFFVFRKKNTEHKLNDSFADHVSLSLRSQGVGYYDNSGYN